MLVTQNKKRVAKPEEIRSYLPALHPIGRTYGGQRTGPKSNGQCWENELPGGRRTQARSSVMSLSEPPSPVYSICLL